MLLRHALAGLACVASVTCAAPHATAPPPPPAPAPAPTSMRPLPEWAFGGVRIEVVDAREVPEESRKARAAVHKALDDLYPVSPLSDTVVRVTITRMESKFDFGFPVAFWRGWVTFKVSVRAGSRSLGSATAKGYAKRVNWLGHWTGQAVLQEAFEEASATLKDRLASLAHRSADILGASRSPARQAPVRKVDAPRAASPSAPSIARLGAQRPPASLDIRGWVNRPGVRLVAVEFYATWCKPCMDAVPRWKTLHEQYRNRGLRLVVVATQDPEGQCLNPGWNPDDVVCDTDGRIARALSVGESLPAAFLWSWQGDLLVRRGHVDAVEAAVRRYLAAAYRVDIEATDGEGRPDPDLAALLRAEVARSGKLAVVATEAERAALAEVRRRSHAVAADSTMACELGKEITANSLLRARVSDGRLSLVLLSAERGCALSGATTAWRPNKAAQSAAEALDKLLSPLRHPPQMPGGGIAAAPRASLAVKASVKAGQVSSGLGRMRVEGTPTGAQVRVQGPGKFERMITLPEDLDGLDPGEYTLDIQASGRVPEALVATVRPDRTELIRVALQAPGGIEVVGDPPDASVEVFAPGGKRLMADRLPLQGSDLLPGAYRVRVTREGYQTYDESHDVRGGETTKVSVRLRSPGGKALFAKLRLDPKLPAEYRRWGERCRGEDLSACYQFARAYKRGLGVAKDLEAAEAIYRNACEGGYRTSCASIHKYGFWSPMDKPRAARLYGQACEGGEPLGCRYLGVMHEEGDGIPRDARKAAELYKRACEGGEAKGCAYLKELSARGWRPLERSR